jgi:hypothetical protein
MVRGGFCWIESLVEGRLSSVADPDPVRSGTRRLGPDPDLDLDTALHK